MRLTPQHWNILEKIFLADGFVLVREKGSHRCYTKEGIDRPVVIPKYPDVGIDIILGLMRTAGMSRNRYFELLNSV